MSHDRMAARRGEGLSPRGVTVGDVMGRPPITASLTDTLGEAASRMRRWRVGALVVVDGREIVGVLAARDVAHHAATGRPAGDATVAAWLRREVEVVEPTLSAVEAGRLALRVGHHHLPVAEDGELVGVVSLSDLVAPLLEVGAQLALSDVAGTGDAVLEDATFEARWHHLLHGDDPDSLELFLAEIDEMRTLPSPVRRVLASLPVSEQPSLAPVVVGLDVLDRVIAGRPPREMVLRPLASLPALLGQLHPDPPPVSRHDRTAALILQQLGQPSDREAVDALELALLAVSLIDPATDGDVLRPTRRQRSFGQMLATAIDLLGAPGGGGSMLIEVGGPPQTPAEAGEVLRHALLRGESTSPGVATVFAAVGIPAVAVPVLLALGRGAGWSAAALAQIPDTA